MADNKINLPSSGGGLMSYSDEVKSKLYIKPMHVIVLIVIVALVELYLYKFGL